MVSRRAASILRDAAGLSEGDGRLEDRTQVYHQGREDYQQEEGEATEGEGTSAAQALPLQEGPQTSEEEEREEEALSALQEKPGKESRIRITLNGGVMGIAVTGDLTLDQLNLAADIL